MPPTDINPQTEMPEKVRQRIIRLMKRIGKPNSLLEVIDAQTGKVSSGPNTISILLKAMDGSLIFDWREGLVAALALGYVSIPSEDSYRVAVTLGKILNNRKIHPLKRWGSVISKACLVMGFCIVFVITLTGIVDALVEGNVIPIWLYDMMRIPDGAIGILILFVPFLSLRSDAKHAKWVREAALGTLAHLQLPESVGELTKALLKTNYMADQAYKALRQTLPGITINHYGQMPPDTIPVLCSLLQRENWIPDDRGTQPKTQQLVLEALEKIGDGRALSPVEKYVVTVPSTKLRNAAQAILPILRARREQEESSSILLRGSSAPPTQPAELLRAASHTAQIEPEQLLRATIGPTSDTGKQN